MSERGWHVLQIGLFLTGGVVLVVLGQIPLGAAAIGAAVGNALPTSLIPNGKSSNTEPPK